jgi:glycosyltransferase involved in cell wall biosynthesis
MNNNEGTGLKVAVLGLRGMPDVPGGVEMHVSELYPRIAALGADVTVFGRSPYRPTHSPSRWKGVAVRWLWSPRLQGVEAVVHTFLGVLYAAVSRPDVLHIHAVGPWLVAPLAKLFGLKVVITHHGQDYLREKWKEPARAVLRLGERLGVNYADETIVISRGIQEVVRNRYGRPSTLIPNGVGNLTIRSGKDSVARHGLAPYRYIIQVSRLVPEKRQLDLIAAFTAANLPGWKLLLVGGAQGSQSYANRVRQQSASNADIVHAGFLAPAEVHELLAHAGIFVLPSSHEGLPISLLEAMKLGTPALASAIPANLETELDQSCYFGVGDVQGLAQRLRELAQLTPEEREVMAQRLRNSCVRYDWDLIAELTLKVLERAAGKVRTYDGVQEERRVPPRLGESYRR